MEVMIDGVRYVPADSWPDEVKFYYMHDNHTFAQLHGGTIKEVLNEADTLANRSRCGMLCPPILLANGKEVRRLRVSAHAPCCGQGMDRWTLDKQAWLTECTNDNDVMRLMTTK